MYGSSCQGTKKINLAVLEKHLGPMGIPLGDKEEWCELYYGTLPNSKVTIYFIEHLMLYGSRNIYGPTDSNAYDDNLYRFAILCRGAFQMCKKLNWFPDVINAHDWPAALALTFLKTLEHHGPFLRSVGVLTIHNVGYQGIYSKNLYPTLGLGPDDFENRGFEFYGKVNLLKSAMVNADEINAVSPSYAEEIKEENLGFGLEGVLRERNRHLRGILNGMDRETWDPLNDIHTPSKFDATSLEKKQIIKKYIQTEFKVKADPNAVVIGFVSRLVSQKGMGELVGNNFGSLSKILELKNVQVLVLGTGETWAEENLRELDRKYKNLGLMLRYDEKISHNIIAGSDFFLMPSNYEPCGLTQMYSLRYGTLPIVSSTGGLLDTVKDLEKSKRSGTGFFIPRPLQPKGILDAVRKARDFKFDHPDSYKSAQIRGMKEEFSWKIAAQEYMAMYETALNRRY
jgi:starch synthase